MKYLITAFFIILLAVSAMADIDEANCEKPYFVTCPDTIRDCTLDTVFAKVKATHPKSEHAQSIRYYLIDGPGEVDEKTGLWSFYNPVDPGTKIKAFDVEISASIGQSHIRTEGDENCRFTVILSALPRNPYILIEGQAGSYATRAQAPGFISVGITSGGRYPCPIALEIESITPKPSGDIHLFNNSRLKFRMSPDDAEKRFVVTIRTVHEPHTSVTIVFDTRTVIPAPEFVNCPVSFRADYCDNVFFELNAVHPDFKDDFGIRFEISSGPGRISKDNRHYFFQPMPTDSAQLYQVEIQASYLDISSEVGTCIFDIQVADFYSPDFTANYNQPCGKEFTAPMDNTTTIEFTAGREWDDCDYLRYYVASISPEPSGRYYISQPKSDSTEASFNFVPGRGDEHRRYEVTIGASNKFDSAFCEFIVNTQPATKHNVVRLERNYTSQGKTESISITMDSSPFELSGFNFLLEYNPDAFNLIDVQPGEFMNDCGWEYLTYSLGNNIFCGYESCPNGVVEIIGIADIFNTPETPSCYNASFNTSRELLNFDLRVTNDREMECSLQPLRFIWYDCYDNVLHSKHDDLIFVSSRVFDRDSTSKQIEITDHNDPNGYPTIKGCQASSNIDSNVVRLVDFHHGSLDIACADSLIDCSWIHGPSWIIGSTGHNYFLEHLLIGTLRYDQGSEAAYNCLDLDFDDIPATLNDFIMYCLSVSIGPPLDWRPLQPHRTATLQIDPDLQELSIHTSDTLAGAFFIFNDFVEPVLLKTNMYYQYQYNPDSNQTRVLVYPSSKYDFHAFTEGPLLGNISSNRIEHVEVSTADGRIVDVTIDSPTDVNNPDHDLPSEFKLSQNFPNPFNPSTSISFDLPQASLIEFEVFNIMGQTVFSQKTFYPAGFHYIEWDVTKGANTLSSGVYYYRLTARICRH